MTLSRRAARRAWKRVHAAHSALPPHLRSRVGRGMYPGNLAAIKAAGLTVRRWRLAVRLGDAPDAAKWLRGIPISHACKEYERRWRKNRGMA